MSAENLLRIGEAAQRLGISTSTLRREIADGRLAVVRIGRCIRFRAEDIEAYRRGMDAKPDWWPRVWEWNPECLDSWTQEPWKGGGCRACILAGKEYWLRSLSHIEANAKPPADWDYQKINGGVYFFFAGSELRYIGIASEYTRRFWQHAGETRGWDRVFLLPLWREAALAVEGYYIRTLQPPGNTSAGDQCLWDWNP